MGFISQILGEHLAHDQNDLKPKISYYQIYWRRTGYGDYTVC